MTESKGGEIRLVVGLGNPGPQYRHTRHNVGYRVVDLFAAKHGLGWRRFPLAMVGGGLGDMPYLLKPLTFMNLSGAAVQWAARRYEIAPWKIILIFDDMDMPLGTIRVRKGGGDGGHRGVRSVVEKLETTDIPRIRVGIGRPPPDKNPSDYVLAPFNSHELEDSLHAIQSAAEALETALTMGLNAAMNKYNIRTSDFQGSS